MESRPAAFLLEIAQQSLYRMDLARTRPKDLRGGEAGAQRGGKVTRKATPALACGEVFEGVSVGADGETVGAAVFNTAHTGYPEFLTDPSDTVQPVTFTASEAGNNGMTRDVDP